MRDSSFATQNYQVICVCGGYGFPLGNASAARITVVGKALQRAGIAFRLLHCGPSSVTINSQKSGVYEGIPFEYTTSVRRPENRLLRILVYVWAFVGLTIRLAAQENRRATLVYLYVPDGLLNLGAGCLCKLLGIPVVQELCEWFEGEPTCSPFNRWLYRKPIFKLATGALVISRTIEERVRKRSADLDLQLLIHRLPSIVDAARFAAARPLSDVGSEQVPNFVYCGTWRKDVFFVLRAFTLVKRRGYNCRLKIVGAWNESDRAEILEYMRGEGIAADVVFVGVIDDRALEATYKMAIALLAPLWNDDRSKTRVPNKIGEYLASGRPVVGCKIGDLTEFLVDDVNAYLAEPGNELDFAEKMIAVLRHPDLAKQIGAAGQEACIAHLDYGVHSTSLAKFFADCADQHTHRCPTGTRRISQNSFFRNIFCELLAVCIIGSGRVRRAKRKALSSNVITSIYFHNPNRNLFAGCIQWLTKNGYTFISLNDLVDILYRGKAIPRGAVWLSFDDGYKEWIDDVMPLVRRRELPVTFFIPAGIVNDGGLLPWLRHQSSTLGAVQRPADSGRDTITVSELKAIAGHSGVTIGGHTLNHTVTRNLRQSETRFELCESKRMLESWTGDPVQCFAYPMGLYSGEEKAVLKELGYKLAATTSDAFITMETDPYLLPRFSVADNISFPEAICNMVGVWRPAIERLKNLSCRIQGREPAEYKPAS